MQQRDDHPLPPGDLAIRATVGRVLGAVMRRDQPALALALKELGGLDPDEVARVIVTQARIEYFALREASDPVELGRPSGASCDDAAEFH